MEWNSGIEPNMFVEQWINGGQNIKCNGVLDMKRVKVEVATQHKDL